MSGVNTNRTNISLPGSVASEIIQKTQDDSAIMKLATKINLPGRGLTIPVITSDPTAAWVNETDAKPASNPGLSTKLMKGYTVSIIELFSNQFKRDDSTLYNALVKRLPLALAKKFDETVFGNGDAPGDNFDTFAACTQQSLSSDAYDGLVAADTNVALNGGIVNGYAITPQMRSILLSAKDKNDRPLFINSVADGAIPMILGQPTYMSRAAYVSGSPHVVGVAGDWTKAMYGVVEGVDVSISTDATITLPDTTVINLFQRNMFAVRAEMEIGFVAQTEMFNLLTASTVPSI